MATIRDVARHAGVSAGTVSNVLNRPSYVGAEVRERVQAAIRELEFTPSRSARQFRPGRVRTLGMIMASMDNPFFVDVGLAAESAAREQGVALLFCHSGWDETREEYNLDLLVQQRVQGVIITPVNERTPTIDRLRERGVPLVFVDRVFGDPDCCSVTSDHAEGARRAAVHLIDRGHERVAFVGDPALDRLIAERFAGFRGAFGGEDAARVQQISGDWTVEAGRRAADVIAAQPARERPTAVMCANDMVALGVLQRLSAHGLRVPQDIAIVGYDDIDAASAAAVPLTTVSQPRAELGREAFALVMSEIDGMTQGPDAHEHVHTVRAPELVVRDSA